jgi:hypothetical protein
MVAAFDVDIAEFDSFCDPISTPPPLPLRVLPLFSYSELHFVLRIC